MLKQITGNHFGSYMQCNKFNIIIEPLLKIEDKDMVLSTMTKIYSSGIDFGNSSLYWSMGC